MHRGRDAFQSLPLRRRQALTPSGMRSFTLGDFDFALPSELIAQHPAHERSGSRLLDATAPQPADRIFRELPQLLQAGDLLVFNDTRVVKARVFGEKPTGGKAELLIERVIGERDVVAHMKVSKKPPVGTVLNMQGGFTAILQGRWPDADGALFRFRLSDDPYLLMEQHGHVPLPPYIEHSDTAVDVERYQTVFAKTPGAVAAPTAALHFDEDLLARLAARGIDRANVTLHVGAGTFQPVKTDNIAEHSMHSEWYELPEATQEAIVRTRERGGKIVAVGTTTVRTLESWAQSGLATGDTTIFITPGFRFKVVDRLVTNFHLPRSTLLMLVSAFAGYDRIMNLYRHAIAQRYRFFSYGDAMLLARSD
jgi:S-adenosylmethionine:tRNA ribosyltransferase-isomerase